MREGLEKETWRKNAIYIGYDAFGRFHRGRWGGWPRIRSAAGTDRPRALIWDGEDPSTHRRLESAARFTVWSPQIEFMNLVFM